MKNLEYQNGSENTLWVVGEHAGCGSFIKLNDSCNTYTAMLEDDILGAKYRTLEGAKKAMQKRANQLNK